jgi:N-acetyl-1-D-myo-inositol-2-amino-2-deoxy-alpha-D-glucopyranoside deacetylase
MRLLAVHAHPDDESITTGLTLARQAAAGVRVVLVTCTRGEQGEVIPPELRYLSGDALAVRREVELAAALSALGVSEHRFLAAPSGERYRDSGMALADDGSVVLPETIPAGAFAVAEVEEAAWALAAVIAEVDPQVVVSYDPGGGYGHPDHVQAHRVSMRAVELAEQSGHPVPRVFWVLPGPEGATTAIGEDPDGGDALAAKTAALRAHATQITVAEPEFALSNGIWQPIAPVEYFRLVRGRAAPGIEVDLFAGLPPGP